MFQEPYMRKIVAIVGIAAILALGAYTYATIKNTDYYENMPVTISVTGEGEVFGKPDVASISFTVTSKEKDQATAQTKSAEKVNAILAFLKENGVEEKDIRTEFYNLYPTYDYSNDTACYGMYCPPVGDPKIVGYEASQNVTVKVRKIDDVGKLLSGVGELGATNASGPSFVIDDDTALKAEAREKAIADARAKAEKIAASLGVKIVRLSSFWEEEAYPPMPYYGMGGEGMMALDAKATVPEIPVGEGTITSRVSISYEIK